MQYFANLIKKGHNHFSSGIYNSEEFNKFYKGFKKAFTTRLKRLNATDIEFSKGHFTLSGFFTVDEQAYYFCLPDVRSFNFNALLLIRTAKDYKDFVGGHNRYVLIDNIIEDNIAQIFGLPTPVIEKTGVDKKIQKFIEKLKENEVFTTKVSSAKKARQITWAVAEHFGYKNLAINIRKYGKAIDSCSAKQENFSMHFDMDSKTLTIALKVQDNVIDLDDISAKSRYQDCQQTLLLLKQDAMVFWSWGAQNPTKVKENILCLTVNGRYHKGKMYIALNGSDLFDVYLTTHTNELVDKLEDLYFDMLTDAIDRRIESVGE